MYFGFTFDLNNPVRSILSAKDGALYRYKTGVRQLRTGPTFDPYDQPNPFADFDLAGKLKQIYLLNIWSTRPSTQNSCSETFIKS